MGRSTAQQPFIAVRLSEIEINWSPIVYMSMDRTNDPWGVILVSFAGWQDTYRGILCQIITEFVNVLSAWNVNTKSYRRRTNVVTQYFYELFEQLTTASWLTTLMILGVLGTHRTVSVPYWQHTDLLYGTGTVRIRMKYCTETMNVQINMFTYHKRKA